MPKSNAVYCSNSFSRGCYFFERYYFFERVLLFREGTTFSRGYLIFKWVLIFLKGYIFTWAFVCQTGYCFFESTFSREKRVLFQEGKGYFFQEGTIFSRGY